MTNTNMTRRLALTIAIQYQTNGLLPDGLRIAVGVGLGRVLPIAHFAFVYLTTRSGFPFCLVGLFVDTMDIVSFLCYTMPYILVTPAYTN